MINLRSDTFTLPSDEMRQIMQNAEVGDDYYQEDESTNKLQEYCKELFKTEDALFTTSGMLSNRLALMAQTSPGDEVITEHDYHINLFESGATAALAGVVLNTLHTLDGVIRVQDVKKAIDAKPRENIYAQVKLLSIENTINSKQGKVYPLNEIEALFHFCHEKGIHIHLDGARIFNAHIATGIPIHTYAKFTDTLNVCFSKGLGSPFGSMLLGSSEIINKARRLRVWLGSGFHQIGMNAKACHFALTSQIERLKEDHRLTKLLAKKLSSIPVLAINLDRIETNMIFFDVSNLKTTALAFIERCEQLRLQLCEWSPSVVRIVVHRDVTELQINEAYDIIAKVIHQYKG